MKKLLSSLFASILVTTNSVVAISCAPSELDLFKINSVDIKEFNYVTGPYKEYQFNNPTQNENDLVHGFMADAMHNYGVYKVNDQYEEKEKWEFFGNLENVKKYNNDKIELKAFKNETVYSQLILISKENIEKVDIKVETDENIEVEVFKSGFVYNTWFDSSNKRPWRTKFSNINQRIADSLEVFEPFSMIENFLQPIFLKIKVKETLNDKSPSLIIKSIFNDGEVVMNNEINLNIIDKNFEEMDKNFNLGASPFVFSDIFKYSKKNDDGEIEQEDMIDFLSPKHKEYLTPKLKSLYSHGQKYIWSWASNMSDKSDRYKPVRSFDDLNNSESKKPVDNAFLDGTHTGLIKWKYDGLNWTFDFSEYDKFIEYISELGFEQFWAANLVFNIETDGYGNFKDQYRKIQYYNEDDVLVYKEMNLNPNEKTREINYSYLLNKFLKEFNNHIKSKNSNVKNYLVFDEVNKETVALMNSLLKENKEIKKHAFAGFKWSIDVNDKNEMDQLLGIDKENSIQELVFGGYKIQEMFPELNEEERAIKFREISKIRKENGLSTMMYAARSTYPSTLVQSDYGDNLWAGLNATKLGLDGYFKWAFDKWVDNKVGDPGVGEENGNQHRPNTDPYNDGGYLNQSPTGDEFLVYPSLNGDTNFVSSVRWELMRYSQQQAIKMKFIEKNDIEYFKELVSKIKWPLDPSKNKNSYAIFDNYYMWDSNLEIKDDLNYSKISAGNTSIYATKLLNNYFDNWELK